MTLLYFAQSLFLVFASVYIAKESIETVLLGEGAHSHGGGGGHGHGAEREHGHDHEGEAEARYVHQPSIDHELTDSALPLLLLAAAVGTSLFSGIALLNHSKLVECEYLKHRLGGADHSAVGSLFMPSVLVRSRISKQLSILRNPFTMTIAGASAAILFGSMLIAPQVFSLIVWLRADQQNISPYPRLIPLPLAHTCHLCSRIPNNTIIRNGPTPNCPITFFSTNAIPPTISTVNIG